MGHFHPPNDKNHGKPVTHSPQGVCLTLKYAMIHTVDPIVLAAHRRCTTHSNALLVDFSASESFLLQHRLDWSQAVTRGVCATATP